jgi:hypothetical protein
MVLAGTIRHLSAAMALAMGLQTKGFVKRSNRPKDLLDQST